MNPIVSLLLKILSHALVQELVVRGLEVAAKRSDNTVDDTMVAVVREALANWDKPAEEVGE